MSYNGSKDKYEGFNFYVAGEPTYYPAVEKNGRQVAPSCTVPVYGNVAQGPNSEKVVKLELKAWGRRADVMARYCHVGKALSFWGSIDTYNGRLFDANGNVRLDNTGQPIMVKKFNVKVDEVAFGPDAPKQIAMEIDQGLRPIEWQNASHPNTQKWNAWRKSQKNVLWDGSNKFGFANVRKPSQGNVLPPGTGDYLKSRYETAQATNNGTGFEAQVQNAANSGQSMQNYSHNQSQGWTPPANGQQEQAPAQQNNFVPSPPNKGWNPGNNNGGSNISY